MRQKLTQYAPLIGFAVVCLLLFWAIEPLLHRGFFTIHDDQQIARLYEITDALSHWQIPPRWVSNLGFGYGYPLFNFYPPLIYYVGWVFHVFGFSLITSTKLVIAVGFLGAAASMYLWTRKYFGVVPAIVAAILYTYAPYHILDIYVRGAMAEFFSFVWIPAVFWSFANLAEQKTKKWMVISAVLLASVVLTHNLVALPFVPFFGIYALILLLTQKNKKSITMVYLGAGLLALGLSMFFWAPALLEKKYTLVDSILTRELADYAIHFVYPSQLWQTPWGYGGSAEGLADGFSLKIGKIHVLIGVLAAVLFCINLVWKKVKNMTVVGAAMLLCLLSIFMTLPYSKWLWDLVQPLEYLQFPWRYLLFVVVFVSFLGAAAIYFISKYVHPVVSQICAIVVIAGSISLMRPYIPPLQYLGVEDNYYIENQDIEWRVSRSSFEYITKGVATTISPLNTTIVDIEENEIATKSFESVNRSLVVSEKIDTPDHRQYTTQGFGTLVIHTYMFPGWKAFIDGEEVSITPYGKLRLISIAVPDGAHTVDIRFTNTPIRSFSNSVSGMSIGIAVALFVYTKKKKEK